MEGYCVAAVYGVEASVYEMGCGKRLGESRKRAEVKFPLSS